MAVRMLATAALLAASTAFIGCADRPTDIEAGNIENTNGYTVLADERSDGAVLVRVRLEDLDDANEVADKLIEQKKPLNYQQLTIEFIGPDDPDDSPARRTRTWASDEPAGSGTS